MGAAIIRQSDQWRVSIAASSSLSDETTIRVGVVCYKRAALAGLLSDAPLSVTTTPSPQLQRLRDVEPL